MPTITPFLWFNDQAEEAATFYVSLFPGAEISSVSRYGEGAPVAAGKVMSVQFRLAGQEFIALNGGPQFTFSPAVSFLVSCKTQQEIDDLWDKLSTGGERQRCGWLKDRFGLTWQIVPDGLGNLIKDPRALQAMLTMEKIEIARLEAAVR
jgi:predicted 3-demethylubiquinone-9 3-methyltransferase (glyoxalase superfamily)